jgi:hypothetical protein
MVEKGSVAAGEMVENINCGEKYKGVPENWEDVDLRKMYEQEEKVWAER